MDGDSSEDGLGVTPPKKKKKVDSTKPDPLNEIKDTLTEYIGHCKRVDQQKNAFMEKYLDMFAKANNISQNE